MASRRSKAARSDAARRGWATRRAREAAEEAARLRRSAAATLGWERRRARDAGADITAVVATVYRGRRTPSGADTYDALDSAMRVIGSSLPRGAQRVDSREGRWISRWELRVPLTSSELADIMADVPWNDIDLDGMRLHLGVTTDDGDYLPLGRAYEEPADVGIEAVDSLNNDLKKYRGRSGGR